MSEIQIHPTAVVDPGAVIGRGTAIWQFSRHISRPKVVPSGIFAMSPETALSEKIALLDKMFMSHQKLLLAAELESRTMSPFLRVSSLKITFFWGRRVSLLMS